MKRFNTAASWCVAFMPLVAIPFRRRHISFTALIQKTVGLAMAFGLLVASSHVTDAAPPVEQVDSTWIQSIGDVDQNGFTDSADLGVMLLRKHDGATDADVANTPQNSLTSVTGGGVKGLHAKNYIVTDQGIAFSVIDVYIKFGSAVGSGTNGERVVNFLVNQALMTRPTG